MKICAFVVTHNRLALLQKVVGGLRGQTRPLDGICVVNNGSGDGTREWLDAQPDLVSIHQENVGPSGGFHAGLKWGCENGFDWIWCMDDDVFPEPEAAAEIAAFIRDQAGPLNAVSAGAARISDKTGEYLCQDPRYHPYGLTYSGRFHGYPLQDYLEKPFLEIDCFTFEGPCIKADAVRAVGLPRAEFFFYEDLEYSFRLKTAGSLFVLPKARIRRLLEIGSTALNTKGGLIKHYFAVRNGTWFYLRQRQPDLIARLATLFFVLSAPVRAIQAYRISQRRGPTEVPFSYVFRVTCRALFDGLLGRQGPARERVEPIRRYRKG